MRQLEQISKESQKMVHSLNLLAVHCESLDDETQMGLIGAGNIYKFNQQGVLIGCDTIDGNNDKVAVEGSEKEPYPLSGSISSLSQSTTYPQSGSAFTGASIDSGVFQYLANNTSVEWAYCYKEGEEGGYLVTSNDANKVGISENKESFLERGYDNVMHNHAQRMENSGYAMWSVKYYNSLPSKADIDWLKDYGFTTGHIYNELTGGVSAYNKDTSEIQDYYQLQ